MANQLGIWSTALLVLALSVFYLPAQQRTNLIQPLGAVTTHFDQKL